MHCIWYIKQIISAWPDPKFGSGSAQKSKLYAHGQNHILSSFRMRCCPTPLSLFSGKSRKKTAVVSVVKENKQTTWRKTNTVSVSVQNLVPIIRCKESFKQFRSFINIWSLNANCWFWMHNTQHVVLAFPRDRIPVVSIILSIECHLSYSLLIVHALLLVLTG